MKRQLSSRQMQADFVQSDGLAWKDIVYDIPIKSKRKAKGSTSSPGSEAEKAVHVTPTPAHSPHVDPPAPGTRRILSGISGSVPQGSYVGLLGASGAGKTTLLNILSARLSRVGSLKGAVTYGGLERDPGSWKRTVGYVEQDDIMLPQHTVRETIEVAARLRLPNKEFSRAEKMQRVEETIDMLRLEGCEGSRIGGGTTRGVSGGERKRTSIAVELVSDVSLLFLDEPTSGLDSFAASLLVDNVSRIVKERNLACLMTVHQPSWAIFCKLDRVILLARGSVYYDGPPRDTIAYFASLGYDVPEGVNPADHFIGIAENKERDAEGEKRVLSLIERWAEHVRARGVQGMSDPSLRTLQGDGPVGGDSGDKARETMQSREKHLWPTPWWEEFGLLFVRWYREAVRDKQTLFGSIGQTVFLLLIIGFGFFRLKNTQSDVLPTIGVLFFIPINAIFSVLFPLLTPFAQQRALMFRERSAGLYRTSSFYCAKAALEIPNAIASRFIYYVVLYFMVGLRLSAGHFFIYLGINLLQLIVAVGLGLAIGAMSPSIEIANIIAPLVNVIFLLFGGTFQPSPPPWFVWLKWISPINYTFSALAQNEFEGREVRCDSGAGGGQEAGASGACYGSGSEVVSAYNIGAFSVGENVGFLCALAAVFFLAGYLGLRFTGKPQMRFK